jgi:hypothetical protein
VTNARDDVDELRRLTDELFITTDLKDWDALRALFVDGPIEVDRARWPAAAPSRPRPTRRLDGFRHDSKLTRGNDAVRTHSR